MTIKHRILLTMAIMSADKSGGNRLLTGLGKPRRHRDLLRWMPPSYPRRNFYAQVRRMVGEGQLRRGEIRTGEKKLAAISLTPAGLGKLAGYYGHLGLFGDKWDGIWRLVVSRGGVPQSGILLRKTGNIGQILRRFGFGKLARGVYVSPFDPTKLLLPVLEERGVLDKFLMFSIKDDANGWKTDVSELVNQIWNLTELAGKYSLLVKRWQIARGQQLKEKRKIAVRRIRSDFAALAAGDPFLPAELLPRDWPIFDVRERLNLE